MTIEKRKSARFYLIVQDANDNSKVQESFVESASIKTKEQFLTAILKAIEMYNNQNQKQVERKKD